MNAAHRFARDAMATTFEIVISGETADYARQAADAAFDELDRLEAELSRFVPHSDVSQLHAAAAGVPVCVGQALVECLELARRVWRQTGGAFDVTLGSGMDSLSVDAAAHLVTRLTEAVRVDLGAIGKGYAVDAMADVLADWRIARALIHGGTSSARAIGPEAWPVVLRHPKDRSRELAALELRACAIGGSANELHGPHIIDPRTGQPPPRDAAWAIAPAAALADAMSTAAMLLTDAELNDLPTDLARRIITFDGTELRTWQQ